jgi:hypothetical protein
MCSLREWRWWFTPWEISSEHSTVRSQESSRICTTPRLAPVQFSRPGSSWDLSQRRMFLWFWNARPLAVEEDMGYRGASATVLY